MALAFCSNTLMSTGQAQPPATAPAVSPLVTLRRSVMHRFGASLSEWLARDKTLPSLGQSLEHGGQGLLDKWRKLSPAMTQKPANLAVVAHIITIERWGQRRLRVALGEALPAGPLDQSGDYAPALGLDWAALLAEFEQTRQTTLVLVGQLMQLAPAAAAQKIPHNGFGALSLTGWLSYLNAHANAEHYKIR
jgi:hypothetical protein